MRVAPAEEAIKAIAEGQMIILVDDEDRENEGDFVVATDKLTVAHLNFMTQLGRGLPCISITRERARRLGLDLQVQQNNSGFRTPFAMSVDLKSSGERGVVASERVACMQHLIAREAQSSDFVTPGNVFPLLANESGVLGRDGQTEGSLDLARLAGLEPSAVICEVMADDGEMLRGDALQEFADKHSLLISSVEEVARYRMEQEVFVREVSRRFVETDFGEFQLVVFEDDVTGKEHLAFLRGSVASMQSDERGVLCRVHSECLTGDVFGSARCDCGPQLHQALSQIATEDCGLLLYLRQEGRGIGLLNKLRAYELQDGGADTVEANLKLGFEADGRNFAVAAKMLDVLGVSRLRLMTNNPKKVEALASAGIEVCSREPLICEITEQNRQYLSTKREKLGHLF